MSNQIRYVVINGSMWFSLTDVTNYLKHKEAISKERNIEFLFRKEVAKKMAKGNRHFNFHCTLSLRPFDEFYDWVQFSIIYRLCLKSEVEKIKSTGLLTVMDDNNMSQIVSFWPELEGVFNRVRFLEMTETIFEEEEEELAM